MIDKFTKFFRAKIQQKAKNQQKSEQPTQNVSNVRTLPFETTTLRGVTHDGQRDMYAVLGYPQGLSYQDYKAQYDRQPIAKRVVEAFPDAIWSRGARITEDMNQDDDTPFEEASNGLLERLNAFEVIRDADVLCGIGRYSVIVIGVADNQELSEPLRTPVDVEDIAYLRPYSEGECQINILDTDPNSPRYGLPILYQIKPKPPEDGQRQSITQSFNVHWTRAIHITQGTLGNPIYGTPVLKVIYNNLLDLMKVVGGSSEIFWTNGRGGLHLNSTSDFEIVEPEQIRTQIQEWINNFSRVFRTSNIDINPIQMTVDDPSNHFHTVLDSISSSTKIPKRILLGSERGELSSNQDESNWWTRISERRELESKRIIRTFIDKFIDIGTLEAPEQYSIEFPDLMSLSGKDMADIASKHANALASYVNANGADLIVPPEQFVEEVLRLDYDESRIMEYSESELRTMLEEEGQMEMGFPEQTPGQPN